MTVSSWVAFAKRKVCAPLPPLLHPVSPTVAAAHSARAAVSSRRRVIAFQCAVPPCVRLRRTPRRVIRLSRPGAGAAGQLRGGFEIGDVDDSVAVEAQRRDGAEGALPFTRVVEERTPLRRSPRRDD